MCALLLSGGMVQAGPVSVEKAKSEAASFLVRHPGASRAQSVQPSLTLAYTARSQAQQQNAAFYVFNKGQQAGYIVVAGDDRVPAVLGYADAGAFDYANIPDNMKAFLNEYARQIEYLRSHPAMENNAKVDTYTTSVSPLLKNITWNQTKPYNNKCPNDYPTGCVATAMGQVMYYYRYQIGRASCRERV